MATKEQTFGERLRELRHKAGWTQVELSERSGVHFVSIAQYETGAHSPSAKSEEKLLAAFGLTSERPEKPPKEKKAKVARRTRARKQRAQDRVEPAPPLAVKPPVRLNSVTKAWLDQQVENHARLHGYTITEGPLTLTIMRHSDTVELCRIVLCAVGTQVLEG